MLEGAFASSPNGCLLDEEGVESFIIAEGSPLASAGSGCGFIVSASDTNWSPTSITQVRPLRCARIEHYGPVANTPALTGWLLDRAKVAACPLAVPSSSSGRGFHPHGRRQIQPRMD